MGAFEPRATRSKVTLPPDVPSADSAVKDGHPEGVIYKAANGERFRLRHPGPARWQKVTERKRNDKKTTAKR